MVDDSAESPLCGWFDLHLTEDVVLSTRPGAGSTAQPQAADVARRYAELLAENLGQPGFRELLIAAHDVDARQDLLFVLAEPRHLEQLRSVRIEGFDRRSEVQDLSGACGHHTADALAAALSVPLLTEFQGIRFAADSFWRGETHRLSDRPGAVVRIVDELRGLGFTQVIEGPSDAGALIELIGDTADVNAGPLVYLAGAGIGRAHV